MGFDAGQILLDSDNGTYYAGQTIFGRIVFDQGKAKTIHGIYVSCKGFCKVHWTTTETRTVNDRQEEETIDHDSYEEYFKNKVFVVGNANAEHHLQAGHHEFNFTCPIPNNCPSSFEGTHGHIRYRVKAVMVTSGMFSTNKEKTAAIRVHAPVNLNLNPYCKEPLECEMITSYCCWCISAGSSEIRVKLPVGGYCPGQVIPMEINVVNHSSVDIDELNISIKKDIKYEATSRADTRIDNEIIASEKRGPIAGGTTPSWTIELPVPLMDIYNLDGCRFIHIDYIFRVQTEVSGCHEGDEETHPIIFGNIPLLGFQDTAPNPFQNQLPQTGPAGQPPNFTPATIISQPLPNPGYNSTNYPQNTAYPGPAPPYPGSQQYPNVSPYPAPNSNAAYPGTQYPPNQGGYQGNPPNAYPPQPSPYPGPNPNQPYPGANPGQPYPGANPGQPYPGANPGQPYPGANAGQPYPGANAGQPYQGGNPNITNANLVQSGNMGFTMPGNEPSSATPLLPPGANAPYPTSPYNAPSAPSS